MARRSWPVPYPWMMRTCALVGQQQIVQEPLDAARAPRRPSSRSRSDLGRRAVARLHLTLTLTRAGAAGAGAARPRAGRRRRARSRLPRTSTSASPSCTAEHAALEAEAPQQHAVADVRRTAAAGSAATARLRRRLEQPVRPPARAPSRASARAMPGIAGRDRPAVQRPPARLVGQLLDLRAAGRRRPCRSRAAPRARASSSCSSSPLPQPVLLLAAAPPRAPAGRVSDSLSASRSRATSRRSWSRPRRSLSIFARCSASCASRAADVLRAPRRGSPGSGRAVRQSRAPGCVRASRRQAGRSARTSRDRSRTPRTRRRRSSRHTTSAPRSASWPPRCAPRRRKWSMMAMPSAPPSTGSVPTPTSSSRTSAGSASDAVHRGRCW